MVCLYCSAFISHLLHVSVSNLGFMVVRFWWIPGPYGVNLRALILPLGDCFKYGGYYGNLSMDVRFDGRNGGRYLKTQTVIGGEMDRDGEIVAYNLKVYNGGKIFVRIPVSFISCRHKGEAFYMKRCINQDVEFNEEVQV